MDSAENLLEGLSRTKAKMCEHSRYLDDNECFEVRLIKISELQMAAQKAEVSCSNYSELPESEPCGSLTPHFMCI
jgi:hypothetical protein